MIKLFDLLISNIYLYLCILALLIIMTTILLIIASNQKNRKKIKDDFKEAEKVEEELQKVDETPNELENILQKMQEEIDLKPEDVVKKFEEEQEEKAIISYKELVDSVKAGKIETIDDEDTNTNFVESLNIEEPITESTIDTPSVTPQMVKDAITNISASSVKEEPKKFKQSEFISPVYGVMEEKLEYPTVKKTENILDIMNTRDYNALTEEINRQEEFLKALKEFRNNL